MLSQREMWVETLYKTVCVICFSFLFYSCATQEKSPDNATTLDPDSAFRSAQFAYEAKEYESALLTWLELAKLGGKESSFRVAEMYEFALGTDQNLRKAARWYLDAAERGHGEAQCKIAGRYHGGSGVNRNLKNAYKWYWLCSRNPSASRTAKYWARTSMRTSLSVGLLSIGQIQRIEAEAKAWSPKPSLR